MSMSSSLIHMIPEVTELKHGSLDETNYQKKPPPASNNPDKVGNLGQYKYFTKASPSLNHLAYECPGLHGPGTRQEVRRTSMRELLSGKDRIIIPLFQRKYCWSRQQLSGWWKDVVTGMTSYNFVPLMGKSSHSVGKIVLKRSKADKASLICLDGQQRLTTVSLLAAVFRDEALKELAALAEESSEVANNVKNRLKNLVDQLETILFLNVDTIRCSSEFGESETVQHFRLVTSHPDRRSYCQVITAPYNITKLQPQQTDQEKSNQDMAADFFRTSLEETLREKALSGSREERLEYLITWATNSLDRMSPVSVEVMNEINLSQVFLWLQEKSLLGEASLLHDRTPGVNFRASDLVRNLLMSGFMHLTLEEQEETYRKYFINVFEMKFSSPDKMDIFLNNFLSARNYDFLGLSEQEVSDDQTEKRKESRHVGKFEETVMTILGGLLNMNMRKGKHYKPDEDKELPLYARFHSFFDAKCQEFSALPPSSVAKMTPIQQSNDFNRRVCESLLNELTCEALKI